MAFKPQPVSLATERASFKRCSDEQVESVFPEKIADDLEANLRLLEGGEWERALERCNRLAHSTTREAERQVAEYIRETFHGFGPKQSRNLLQALGLTRYEIPH